MANKRITPNWLKKWTELGIKGLEPKERIEEYKKYCQECYHPADNELWIRTYKSIYRDYKSNHLSASKSIFKFNKFIQYYNSEKYWIEASPYNYKPSKIARKFTEDIISDWSSIDEFEEGYVQIAVDFGVAHAPGIKFTKKELELLEKLISSYENYSDDSPEKILLNKIRGELNGRK